MLSYFLKISLWRKSLSHKSQGLSLCVRDMRQLLCNWIRMNRDLKPVTVLKKRLYLRRFLASFVNFYIKRLLRIFGWLLLDFLLLKQLFVNVIKIMNLATLKLCPAQLTRISFLMKSRFILWLLDCIKSVRISLYSVWMWENVDRNNSEYEHFLQRVVL